MTPEEKRARRRARMASMSPEKRSAHLADRKAWREANSDRLREKAREYRAKHLAECQARDVAESERRRINNYTREWKYGMPKGAFERMLSAQGGRCAICPRELKPGQGTHVDHDHETGDVRALLCPRCNRNVAMFDDEILFRKTAAYVLRHRADRKTRVA